MTAHGPSFRAGLERFCRGEAGRDEAREVVRHLLADCPECCEATSRLWPQTRSGNRTEALYGEAGGQEAGGHDYTKAFGQAERELQRAQLLLAEETAAVRGLRQELGRHPRSRQEVLVSNSSRFHSWPLVESLLEDCRRLCQVDSEEASHLARLAIGLSDRLDTDRYGRERVFDLLARAWAELANVLRVQEKHREAEQGFERARDLLDQGTGDPLEKAEVMSLEASMWTNRCEFQRAIALLDQAIAIGRRFRENDLCVRALILKAKCTTDRGLPEEALSLLLDAQKHLDPVLDPRLAVGVQHNILYALVQAGRFEEAVAGLAGTRALYRRLEHPRNQLRLDWLEGRVFHGLGQLDEAEWRFRKAFDGMLAEGLDLDAATIGLDLAVLYSQQNRNAEIRELVAAMLPVFGSHRIHREALAALVVFREAVDRERLSTELAQNLAEYLRRAAVEPHLPFQPPSGLASDR